MRAQDIEATGLKRPSRMRCAKIATVTADRILGSVGRLGAEDARRVREGVARLLAPA